MNNGYVFPPPLFLQNVEYLPNEVNDAYEEAKNCFSVNAFTACELVCRKILMHIAVEKGDSEGKNFTEYIDFLEKNGYITNTIKSWVDSIRRNGNDSTHTLKTPNQSCCLSTLMFTTDSFKNYI